MTGILSLKHVPTFLLKIHLKKLKAMLEDKEEEIINLRMGVAGTETELLQRKRKKDMERK